jgi:cell division protein FtsW
MRRSAVDKIFLASSILLVLFGIFIFSSASMGLLSRTGQNYASVVIGQIAFGVVLGFAALFFASRVPYKRWRTISLYIYIGSILLSFAVFIPHIGLKVYGASRWIALGSLSFQPSELLKIGYILYLATWLSSAKDKVGSFLHGTVPFLAITAPVALTMLAEPDTSTFMVMFIAGFMMFFAAGCRWRDIGMFLLIAFMGIVVLAFARPYLLQRITTFLNPADDPRGAGYQIQQSLIAIGSGGVTGRGFGQSIQKFNFLPEPIGDSIFAVEGEEFGFIGSSLLLLLLCFFTIRGLKIASKAPDSFGGLVSLGIVILIITQSFVNISSMLGIIPLSGLPLIFVSHGGTAMMCALLEVGIVLNISRFQKT